MRWNSFNTYAFDETTFIAVTAYQNEQVSLKLTKLKGSLWYLCQNNIFVGTVIYRKLRKLNMAVQVDKTGIFKKERYIQM